MVAKTTNTLIVIRIQMVIINKAFDFGMSRHLTSLASVALYQDNFHETNSELNHNLFVE